MHFFWKAKKVQIWDTLRYQENSSQFSSLEANVFLCFFFLIKLNFFMDCSYVSVKPKIKMCAFPQGVVLFIHLHWSGENYPGLELLCCSNCKKCIWNTIWLCLSLQLMWSSVSMQLTPLQRLGCGQLTWGRTPSVLTFCLTVPPQASHHR